VLRHPKDSFSSHVSRQSRERFEPGEKSPRRDKRLFSNQRKTRHDIRPVRGKQKKGHGYPKSSTGVPDARGGNQHLPRPALGKEKEESGPQREVLNGPGTERGKWGSKTLYVQTHRQIGHGRN